MYLIIIIIIINVHSQRLELMLADVFEAQQGSPSWLLSCSKFSVEKVLGDTTVLHA